MKMVIFILLGRNFGIKGLKYTILYPAGWILSKSVSNPKKNTNIVGKKILGSMNKPTPEIIVTILIGKRKREFFTIVSNLSHSFFI
jgi:hypothetical protein